MPEVASKDAPEGACIEEATRVSLIQTDRSDELGGASNYILLCSDGSYYTGITRRSVEERVSNMRKA